MNILRYCDPGHSWFKVSRALLKKLDIEHKVSPYSYQRKEMAYLEEDCDADLLFKALDSNGLDYKIVSCHTNKTSRIRNYQSYRKTED